MWAGWGTADGSFWCCYGTAIESFAKLGDSIYYINNDLTPPLPYQPGGVTVPSSAAADLDLQGAAMISAGPRDTSCSGTNVRSGSPGGTGIILIGHGLLAAGHLIDSVSLSFRYAAGYSPAANETKQAATVAVQLRAASDGAVLRTLLSTPPLGNYSFDAFTRYSPRIQVHQTGLALPNDEPVILALEVTNHERNLQIPIDDLRDGMAVRVTWAPVGTGNEIERTESKGAISALPTALGGAADTAPSPSSRVSSRPTLSSGYAIPSLWVAQYVSSTVAWVEAALELTQTARYADDSKAMLVGIAIESLGTSAASSATASPSPTTPGGAGALHERSLRGGGDGGGDHTAGGSWRRTIRLRVPAWAVQDRIAISLNGVSILGSGPPPPGSFVSLTRDFASGDVINASFGMAPRLVPLNDERPEFDAVYSIHYGPLLLAGLTDMPTFALRADPHAIDSWFDVAPNMTFTARQHDGATAWRLRPLNELVNETYTAYFNISIHASASAELCLTLGDAHGHAHGHGHKVPDELAHHLVDHASLSNAKL